MTTFSVPHIAEVTDCYIRSAVIVGGAGPLPLKLGANIGIRFTETEMRFQLQDEVKYPVVTAPIESLQNLHIGGEGASVRGGGFIGGGFGLQGAAVGIGIATLLNNLTTTVSIRTIVGLQFERAELWLVTSDAVPDLLRIQLAPAFLQLRLRDAAAPMELPPAGV